MSQVMPSSLMAGGPTVGLAPCEEPRKVLHAAPSPSLPTQCPYYTTGGWGTQFMMAPAPQTSASSRLQKAPQAANKTNGLVQPPGAQVPGAMEDLDSYLDFSLETLKHMMLELDPNFQLLPSVAGGSWTEPTQSTTSKAKKEEPEALDIKYIEVTSTRSRCHDGPQRGSSPTTTPTFGSPHTGGLLLSRDVPRETRSSSESLIFSGTQGRGPQRLPPQSGVASGHPPASSSISIPSMGNRASGPHDFGSPWGASPGMEKGLGTLTPQQGSRVSVLSASPASDISYVFGSNQSLPHSSICSHWSSSRSSESPANSSSSLHSLLHGSPCTRASDLQTPSKPTPIRAPGVTRSPPLAKEHASSCPPSIANSMVDIPIVLINGRPESGSPPFQRNPGPQDLVQSGIASASSPGPSPRSHSQTLPEASFSTSPEGPIRDMQPTMKFVMDTSKFWFKPNITREQAIELLKKEGPGTFVVRDSSSYRGSFGLALKVQEAPTPTQNQPGQDNSDIRHFLIESSAKGVHLKGADEEPYFGSLSAFVCQHSIMALALPCKLTIPQKELGGGGGATDPSTDGLGSSLKKSAGCQALYLSSVSVETLTGELAVRKAVSTTLERDVLPTPTVVHFRVTEQGITLTDVQRKVFFRRHYPLTTLRFCGLDPEQRKWQKYCKPSRIFGFVAKSQTESQENVCHLFAEYDMVQPAVQVLGLVDTLMRRPERV